MLKNKDSNHLLSLLSFTVRTDPRDVARVESKTFICTEEKRESVPQTKEGIKGKLGQWMSVTEMNERLAEQFPGCMKGIWKNLDQVLYFFFMALSFIKGCLLVEAL